MKKFKFEMKPFSWKVYQKVVEVDSGLSDVLDIESVGDYKWSMTYSRK